jgi:hypothetical protein
MNLVITLGGIYMMLTMREKRVLSTALSLDRKFHLAYPGDESFFVLDRFAKLQTRKLSDKAQTLSF